MPVVIDGNNLLHAGSGAGSRGDVRRQALERVRGEGMTLTVVFDGPPPAGSPAVEHLGRVTGRYSGTRSADDVIVELLPAGRDAADWSVVTDDRALGDRVRRRGAAVRSLAEWRRRRSKPRPRQAPEGKLSSHDVADWEAFFAREREPD